MASTSLVSIERTMPGSFIGSWAATARLSEISSARQTLTSMPSLRM